MTFNVPIPPPLEQILRDQLATGQYSDVSDVVAAALKLLENQPASRTPGEDAAFGLWKGRAPDGIAYEQQIRAEWNS